jgi:hypothetical protein
MRRVRRLRRPLAALFVLALVAAFVPLGCRQILGIQDDGSDALTCEAYCSVIAQACTGDETQYDSTDACMGLCKTFPVGTLDDMSGDTLGCRINQANTILQAHDGVCAAAGPPGAGICGTDCDSFCNGVAQVCPNDFKTQIACKAACLLIPDAQCPSFFVNTSAPPPDYDSLECRFYHLTAATLDPTEHCPHTLGENGFCTPIALGGNACNTADGGTDGG